jgi:hypothetical protein
MIAEGSSEKEIKEAFADGYSSGGQEVIELVKFDFLKNYFLRRDRLQKAIAIQRKFLREDELLYKYKTYLPGNMDRFQTLDELVKGIALDTQKPKRVWTPDSEVVAV